MTSFRFRILGFIAVLCSLTAPALAADNDPDSAGSTFNTPGYPQRAGQMQNPPMQGLQGYGNGQQLPGGANQRTPGANINGNGSGNGADVRQPRAGNNAPYRGEPRPPPKPSEFQKFVEGATGRLLPVFGSAFFSEAADTFNPVDNVPVSADYTVGPGDEIILRAWGSIDIDYRTTVDRNGLLNLPKIGSFNVAGVKASELEHHLQAQIGRLYTNFNLSVALGQLRAVKVFVVGPAQRPGVYTLPSQSTLLSALVAAGGPAPNGSMRKITLRRDGHVVSELDVYDFLVRGDKSKDMQLAAGDVVVIDPAGPHVALTGAVDTRAIYELKSAQEPLREVLRYAGGAPVLANPNKVQLERIDPTQPRAARFVEEFSLDAAGLEKPLRDGDVLTLLAISPQFANAVTLKGHVAQPLRYPYKPGMRIRDLIPDREALISPDFYRRKNLLVQIIEDDDSRRMNRYDPYDRYADPDFRRDPRDGRDSVDTLNRRDDRNGRNDTEANRDSNLPGSLEPRRDDNFRNFGSRANADADSASVRRRSESEQRADDRAAAARAQKAPAALFDELNWDYAVVERLNRAELKTEVIPFNLGKAILQGDEANNIALLPGDVVTIYSQKDIRVPVSRQTRLVSLEGEINSPGVYQLAAGETLRTLLAKAGGFTPQAYVYGLEFSREETRRRQRENLATAMARLQTLSAVQSARDAANRRDDVSGAATSAAVSNAATQAQLARLSRIEPNGRIALELTPETMSLDALPDLPLENADRISVPPRPGFVTVAGAVVNGNAFVWKSGRTAGDYLALAGADEAADPSNMFILRADGTVTKSGEKRGWFSRGGLESQVMQPGDALIVPTQLDFETFGRALVRNLKDFSQIFSGFGIGIAAIHSLNRP
ncbi:MAG: SLBB domain-containing protein [Pseudomonadota bacterium]|nr:SLBB domain-containing protein [Pseudomonadota bacterium]